MSIRTIVLSALFALSIGCDEEERLRKVNEAQRRHIEEQAKLTAGLMAAQNQSADLVAENKAVRSAQHSANTVLIVTGCGLAVSLVVLLRRRPRNAS